MFTSRALRIEGAEASPEFRQRVFSRLQMLARTDQEKRALDDLVGLLISVLHKHDLVCYVQLNLLRTFLLC